MGTWKNIENRLEIPEVTKRHIFQTFHLLTKSSSDIRRRGPRAKSINGINHIILVARQANDSVSPFIRTQKNNN